MNEHPHARGRGGEVHQQASEKDNRLTTNQGVGVADNQNALRLGGRGPSLMEDFVFREKLTHFDHERIPERVVHARGAGAHGYFQPYQSWAKWTTAAFLQDAKENTPVFVRFSTVAGERGSFDVARDVRGFAAKFYTREGNFDLVGNNMPVFFIQDAIKFPDLVHAVKPEPDRAIPQAQSAHDSFWDFISMMPESLHMVTWLMSDRTIPRSFRMMEGFGVHTFRLINAEGEATFVKFHWRPVLGSESVVWDEALAINGADPDFHRRDLWDAIAAGAHPEYELCVQAFDQATADALPFDVLDASKIIAEEDVPLTPVGKMVLDGNPENFFAETEQVAFCPSHLVPGIDFTNDPLLQGRLHSYLDTQLNRFGGPNFHQLPINAPKCPLRNLQRDAPMQMGIPKGRTAHEPSRLDDDQPRECPTSGFQTFPAAEAGDKLRIRAESFADHYSQARQFWISQTPPEQRHIVNGFGFELGKCENVDVRRRMLGHLGLIHSDLGDAVADALGMPGEAESIEPAVTPREDLAPSPPLSILNKQPASLRGRKIGVLLGGGADNSLIANLKKIASEEGAMIEFVAPKIGGVTDSARQTQPADHALSGGPSVLFDAVVVLTGKEGVAALTGEAAGVNWIRDAYAHCKIIGHVPAAAPLFQLAAVAMDADEGMVSVAENGLENWLSAARKHRVWEREPTVSTPG